MGQKVHPYGFRLGYTKPWKSRWFVERDYDKLLLEDVKLKAELKDKLKSAGVSAVASSSRRRGRASSSDARALKSTSSSRTCRNARPAKSMSTFRKFISLNWTPSWFQRRSRCNSKSALGSVAPCAKR